MTKKEKMNKIVISIIIGLICIVLVATILMQFKTVEETDITAIETMREAELRTALSEWKTKYEETNKQLEDTNTKITEYEETADDRQETANLIDQELEQTNMILGKTDVKGPGIIVTLEDGDSEVVASDLVELVNELRYAGAEAISINENRVISSTDIIDMGDYTYIMIDSQRIQGPYVIKAIGNKEMLSTTLSMRGSGFIDRMTSIGINASYEIENRVEIPKYSGDYEIKYMQEVTAE